MEKQRVKRQAKWGGKTIEARATESSESLIQKKEQLKILVAERAASNAEDNPSKHPIEYSTNEEELAMETD